MGHFRRRNYRSLTVPSPDIRVPHYRTGRVGAWELKRQFQPALRGYFRGPQRATENYLLIKDDRVWMSLSPVEIESLAPHVARMRGHVVIAGLGMGLALYNALLRPVVRRVTVIEQDADVIALFEAIRDPDWPNADRFRIEQADALVWRSPEPVDYLYADIWDKVGAPEAAADMRAMCRNLRPKSAGYWGMEANFVSFLAHSRCRPPVTRSQFQAWARTLGVPIAAYDNRSWRERIPDVATQLIFGGSPGIARASVAGPDHTRRRDGFASSRARQQPTKTARIGSRTGYSAPNAAKVERLRAGLRPRLDRGQNIVISWAEETTSGSRSWRPSWSVSMSGSGDFTTPGALAANQATTAIRLS